MEFLIIFLIVGLPLGISAFIAGFSARKDERRELQPSLSTTGEGSPLEAEQNLKQAV